MIIELFGLSGAGKTTFAKKKIGNSDCIVLLYKNYAFNIKMLVLFKYPLFFLWVKEILLETFKNKMWFLFRFKLALLFNLFCTFNEAQKMDKSGKIVLMDEGFLQRLGGIYDTKKDYIFFKQLINKKILLSDKIIIIESSFEKFKRYKDKNNNRSALGEEYLNNWFEVVKYNYQEIIKAIKNLEIDYEIININYEK